MSTAEGFTALGGGNGLHKCVRRLDVSDYDHWTTFSGVSNSSPNASEAKINESIALASKYFWNTESFNFTGIGFNFSDGSSAPFDDEVILNMFKLDLYDFTWEDLGPYEPRLRCLADVTFPRNDPVQPGDDRYEYVVQQDFEGYVNGGVGVAPSPLVARMYNGSTDDEDNFIGYGAAEEFAGNDWTAIVPVFINAAGVSGRFIEGQAREFVSCNLSFQGACNESTDEEEEGVEYNYTVTDFDGLHFVVSTRGSYDNNEYDEEFTYQEEEQEYTVNRYSTVQGSITFTDNSVEVTATRNSVQTDTGDRYSPYNDTVVANLELKFDSLGFYDY